MLTPPSPPIEGNGAPPALALEIKRFVKRYGSFAALKGIDLQIPLGTTSSLLGRHGTDKIVALQCSRHPCRESEEIVRGHRTIRPRPPADPT